MRILLTTLTLTVCLVLSLIAGRTAISTTSALGSVSRGQIEVSEGVSAVGANTNVSIRQTFFGNIERYVIGVLGIIFVGMMLFISFKLFHAEGKVEELKKAWKALAFAGLGLAFVPLAYVVVKVLTGLQF